MTEGQHENPVFVQDEYDEKFTSAVGKEKIDRNDLYTIELKDVNKSIEANENYDPFKHRNVPQPTTNSETLFHLLKGSLGTGILAMPNAFYHAGYVVGTVGTIFIGLICTYCIHTLIKAEYELCKRRKTPSLSYPATCEAAFAEGPRALRSFAPYSVHMVNIFLLVYQLGTCCVYIVFIATNVKSVMDEHIKDIAVELYMLMFLIPLILINWVRNLKKMAPLSTAANAITLVSFGIILYYVIDDGPTFDGREPVGELKHFPLFFGTVLFALEAIGVIMPLENEMKTPKAFGGSFGVLNIGMFTIIILYVGMGLLGYLTYGSSAEGSITLNIPNEEALAQVVKITLALAIYITYALQCYVAVDITWNQYLFPKFEKNSRQVLWEYTTRTCLVIITFLLAVAIPKLSLFISLFGALCLSALGIAIPAMIDLCTYWYTLKGVRFHISLVKNGALILFGVGGLIVGTYTSLHDIIEEFS